MVQKYGGASNDTIPYFVADMKRAIEGRQNHPSIVQFETFNEVSLYMKLSFVKTAVTRHARQLTLSLNTLRVTAGVFSRPRLLMSVRSNQPTVCILDLGRTACAALKHEAGALMTLQPFLSLMLLFFPLIVES